MVPTCGTAPSPRVFSPIMVVRRRWGEALLQKMSGSAEEAAGQVGSEVGSEVDAESSENDLDALVAGFEAVPSRAGAATVASAGGTDRGDEPHVPGDAAGSPASVPARPNDKATGEATDEPTGEATGE